MWKTDALVPAPGEPSLVGTCPTLGSVPVDGCQDEVCTQPGKLGEGRVASSAGRVQDGCTEGETDTDAVSPNFTVCRALSQPLSRLPVTTALCRSSDPPGLRSSVRCTQVSTHSRNGRRAAAPSQQPHTGRGRSGLGLRGQGSPGSAHTCFSGRFTQDPTTGAQICFIQGLGHQRFPKPPKESVLQIPKPSAVLTGPTAPSLAVWPPLSWTDDFPRPRKIFV